MTTRLSEPCTLYTVLYLLPAVRGQVEDEYGEEGDAHTGDDQVDRVEQRLPPQCYVEEDVRIGRVTATAVELLVALGRHRHDVPLDTQVIFPQIDAYLDDIRLGLLVQVLQVHLWVHQTSH